MHVYYDPHDPPEGETAPPAAMTAYLQSRRDRVDANWEEWDDLDQHGGNGLVARLFKLKTWDPEAEEGATCPPTLAFRGTDFHDMRDLAISAQVGLGFRAMPPLWSSPIIVKNFNTVFSMDPTIPEGTTHQGALDMGFTAVPIYRDTGTARGEMANFGIHLNLGVTISLDILARDDGDWLSNLLQGLGRTSPQYADAIEYGRTVVREKIDPLPVKKLEITGHSLGGGLAAATCTVLDHEFPDVQLHAITFNAAGVHQNTVGEDVSLNGAAINNFTVEDEMLTTVQSFTGSIPLVGSVFRLAERHIDQTGMPPALGTMRVIKGKLPPGSPYGSAGRDCPNLFPVQDQTVHPAYTGDFPILSAIDGMLGASASATQFGNRFLTWLNTNYRDRALRSADSTLGLVPIWTLYREMGRLLQQDVQPEIDTLAEIGAAAAAMHGMVYVIATYEHLYPVS